MDSPRDAVILASFCRSEPAAGVAGVFEGRFFLQLLLFFQLEKGVVGHVDLAAHLQELRRAGQLFGNGRMVARFSVTSSPTRPSPRVDRPHKGSVLVFQADRQAVDLDLHHIFRRDAGFPHAGVKLPQLVKAEGILQAFHLDGVGHLAELAAGGAAHMLGGRRRRDQLGVFGLDAFQLPHQRVVLVVLQFGGVLVIVKAVVFLDHLAQLCGALFCLFQFHAVPSADAKHVLVGSIITQLPCFSAKKKRKAGVQACLSLLVGRPDLNRRMEESKSSALPLGDGPV